MSKSKFVIWYLALRPCVQESLELLYRNFNTSNYPVIVFTLGQQYSADFIKAVHRNINSSIQFIELPKPQVPANVPESELFYNRTEIAYVRKSFYSKSRIGYLHAMNFLAGDFIKHPALSPYDWSLRLDDDTFIIKPLPQDLIATMQANRARLGDMHVQAQNYPRVLDCQIGLRELAQKFQKTHGIKCDPWDSLCGFGAFNVFDMSMFREPLWYQWWQAVEDSGGIYKYRWGDMDIHSIYLNMRHDRSVIHDFYFEKMGLIRHSGHGFGYIDDNGRYLTRLPLTTRIRDIYKSARYAIMH